jgi:hypothetical protein
VRLSGWLGSRAGWIFASCTAVPVHFRPQTRTAARIKTATSPIIDVVKSQAHITDVFRDAG